MRKKNKSLCLLFMMLFFLFWGSNEVMAQAKNKESITLTWQDLQKLLDLNANEIKITWDELKKLLTQTGSRLDPDFEIKDGIVTIKRDQFSRILNRMKPTARQLPAPPKDYLFTEAAYTGIAGKQNSRFTAVFKIYVFKQNKPVYINIPVAHTSLAVKDILVNKAPAVILTKGSWHNISINQNGYFEVKVVFSAGQGNQTLYLPVARSIINRIDFTIPKKNLEIAVNPSLNTKIISQTGSTRVTANAAAANQIRIRWTRKVEKRKKQPALFYANTRSLISVDTDILRLRTRVNLEIIQSSLNIISMLVPKNYQVVRIEGAPVSEWKVRETDIGRVLEIPFRYDIDRSANFTIHAEQVLAEDTLAADYTGFKVIDARRETGDIGIAAESTVQVEVEEQEKSKHLEKLAYHKLPKGILTMTSKPILSAFKYSKHPFRLFFRIAIHERLEGITTVIESAEVNALFLKEGKIITHVVYTVRNTFKQFMELELPKEAGIWTVYVDNKRGKASGNEQDKLLIPLLRSSGNGERLKPFPVELVYTLPADRFGISGNGECFIPANDIFINKMRVTMHMPPGYRYSFDKGEWKEVIIEEVKADVSVRPGKPVAPIDIPQEIEEEGDKTSALLKEKKTKPAVRKRDAKEESKDGVEGGIDGIIVTGKVPAIDVRSQTIPQPVSLVRGKSTSTVTGPAGISSIKVHLPLSGKSFVFSKKIVDKDEMLPLGFSYYSSGLIQGLVVLVILIILIVGFVIIRSKIKKRQQPL